MQIDTQKYWKYACHFHHPWLWHWKKKHNSKEIDLKSFIIKFWIEIYFGKNILLVNPKLIYPILALILQLSQKFGEIFDDIGIKVFYGDEISRFI
jgi:hypothetical protein